MLPDDPSVFYSDDYYQSESDSQLGYSEYRVTAYHGSSWAAHLIRLLKPGGRILDIGCADGSLLEQLRDSHSRCGIEVNPRMADKCRQRDIQILGDDLMSVDVPSTDTDRFDVVSAIAVFEHVTSFREAVQKALKMLRRGGVLVFEVPLVSVDHDSGIWFRSSLEHIHYPSARSLHHLVESELSLTLVGGECVIRDFGSTFIGIVRPDVAESMADRQLFARLTTGAVGELQNRNERQTRFHLEVVHAAQPNPDTIALLPEIGPAEVQAELLHRLSYVWSTNASRLAAATSENTRLIGVVQSEHDYVIQLQSAVKSEQEQCARLVGELGRLSVMLDRQVTAIHDLATRTDPHSPREQAVVATTGALEELRSHVLQIQSGLAEHAQATTLLAGRLAQHDDFSRQEVDRLWNQVGTATAANAQLTHALIDARTEISRIVTGFLDAGSGGRMLTETLSQLAAANQAREQLSASLSSAREELAATRQAERQMEQTIQSMAAQAEKLRSTQETSAYLAQQLDAERTAIAQLRDAFESERRTSVSLRDALEVATQLSTVLREEQGAMRRDAIASREENENLARTLKEYETAVSEERQLRRDTEALIDGLRQRDGELSDRAHTLEDKIRHLNRLLENRHQLELELASCSDELQHQRQETLRARNLVTIEKSARTQLQQLCSQLTEERNQVQTELSASQATQRSLEQALASSAEVVRQISHALASRTIQVAALENSLSWRLTSPIRAVLRPLARPRG